MSYSNGSVGTCGCGQMAVAGCERCGKAVCEVHAHEVPEAPPGVSPDAAAHFSLAVRLTQGPTCQDCQFSVHLVGRARPTIIGEIQATSRVNSEAA